MTTFGGVVSGDSGRGSRAAYALENVHVWQSRLLGDASWTNYMNWWIGGSIAGAVYAPFAGENVVRTMDVFGYWNNPYEIHARRSEPGRGPLSAERGAW